jgi:hypothetical protein
MIRPVLESNNWVKKRKMAWLLRILIVLFFFNYVLSGSRDDYEMLKAAQNGETERVIDLITNHGVFLTTKNNYGVR